MNIVISVRGKSWVVDENKLYEWLLNNSKENLSVNRDFREMDNNGNYTGRIILNE